MTTIDGDGDNNKLVGGGGDDNISGNGGDDTLIGGDGGDFLLGGQGSDLSKGGAGDDTLQDDSGTDTLLGGAGDDHLSEYNGQSAYLDGGAGNDGVFASGGGSVTLMGGAGVDFVGIDLTYPAHALLDGGDGTNFGVVSYSFIADPLDVRFRAGADGEMTTANGEIIFVNVVRTSVFLNATADLARVDEGGVRFLGFGGDDTLMGGRGASELIGGDDQDLLKGLGGDDSLEGGEGDDRLVGGARFDYAVFNTATAGVVADLGVRGPQDTGVGLDTLVGVEGLRGSAYSDRLTGDKYDNTLHAGDLDAGHVAGDSLFGGGGDDTLASWAGAQNDVLTGGSGADTFSMLAAYELIRDTSVTITDLAAKDTIDLSKIDADTTLAGDQAFVIVDALDGQAGQAALSYAAEADQTMLSLDVDGDGSADILIRTDGEHLDFDHFVL